MKAALFLTFAFLLSPYFTAAPSVGSLASFHAPKPPSNAAASVKPFDLSVSTAPALVCSAGQVQ